MHGTTIVLYHSTTPGAVPPSLQLGEIGLNVADGFQFVGYGGDVNYDVYGNPLPDLPPPGEGWKTYVIGGGDQPGPPGPGVPPGGDTGQVLAKASPADYVTQWVDPAQAANTVSEGLLYGVTQDIFGDGNVALGFGAQLNIGSGARNTNLGFQAGLNQNDVSDNVVVGYHAGWNIDGGQNVILGSEAFSNNPGGSADGNVGVGYQAGYNMTDGDKNVFIGFESGTGIRSGSFNTFLGNYPGDGDMSSHVVLADGQSNVRFLANEFGAWAPAGTDFGQNDYVLTSQGANLPPIWKASQSGGVTRIVAGANVSISPSSGVGTVTISSAGGGGGSVVSVGAGDGLKIADGGANPITQFGVIDVDYTKVVATALYTGVGALTVGNGVGQVTTLPVGSVGQVLQVQAGNALTWATLPSSSPATPTTLGLVYGGTSNGSGNTSLGYNAGGAITSGTNNLFIGKNAGSAVTTGSNNVVIGEYPGYAGMSNTFVLSSEVGGPLLTINGTGSWGVNGDAGLPGQVLASGGPSNPTQWITPPNAPIQTVSDGPGISTAIIGTDLQISNEGILSINASGPIVATTVAGVTSLSAPSVLTGLTNGSGISVTGTGNTRQIANTGVISLQNGTNTTVVDVGGGVWQVNASGGGGGGITSLQEGAGIDIANPSGPSPTITNSGVVSITATSPIVASASSGSITLSAPNALTSLASGTGISITGTGSSRTITNSGITNVVSGSADINVAVNNGVATISSNGGTGVTKIIAGTNVSISPISGTGEVTINAAGGGGGGSITEILPGTGISVASGTGPKPTITNEGVLNITAGNNVTISGTKSNFTINATGTLNNLTAGAGITISNATGPNATITNSGILDVVAGSGITISKTGGVATIINTGGSGGGAVDSVTGSGPGISVSPTSGAVVVQNTGVTSVTGTTGNITVSSNTGAVTLNVGPNVLTNVTAGNSGITIGGSGNTRTISAAVVGVQAGSGINVTNSSGTITVSNTGVRGLTAGANVTITETTPGSGNYTIASTGGGGGGGVTQLTAGQSILMSPSPITAAGTISVNIAENDSNGVVTWGAYNSRNTKGSLLYTDGTGHAWSTTLPASGTSASNPMQLVGWVGGSSIVQWAYPRVADLVSSDSIDAGGPYTATTNNSWKPIVKETWLKNYVATNEYGNSVGGISFLQSTGTSATWGVISRPASSSTTKVLSLTNNNYSWIDFAGASYTVSAPITLTGSTIGFDTATTALTSYIPKSAFTLAGQLLYGTGNGTYAALNAGSNGQILSVNSSGALTWINPPTPAAPVSLTPANDTILMTPNPITGTGTIGVNSAKFVLAATLATPGDLIVGAGSPALPSTLQASTTVGAILTVTAASGNTRLGWSTTISGGTY